MLHDILVPALDVPCAGPLEKPHADHEWWPAFLVSCAYILKNSERMNTMKVLTARGMRLLEAAAVEEGLDYRRLMENA